MCGNFTRLSFPKTTILSVQHRYETNCMTLNVCELKEKSEMTLK